MKNTQVLLARRPVGRPVQEDFRVIESEVPPIRDGEALLENQFISLDAGFRNWMNEDAGDEVLPAMSIDEPVMGLVAATVAESKRDDLTPGQVIVGRTAWEAFSIAGPGELMTPVQSKYGLSANYYLGVMGDTGLSAYFGLDRVAAVKSGETVLISAAGGAVGNAAGQIAKAMGAGRVVGFAGSEEKCRWLEEEVGYDATINYKAGDLDQLIQETCPDGVDVYFDNTGGMILGSALFRMNVAGRIACCGVVSQYDTDSPEPGPRGIPGLLVNKRLTMQGFLLFDFVEQYAEARQQIHSWMQAGDLISLTDEVKGLEAAPEGFVDLLAGGNVGTRIVRV